MAKWLRLASLSIFPNAASAAALIDGASKLRESGTWRDAVRMMRNRGDRSVAEVADDLGATANA